MAKDHRRIEDIMNNKADRTALLNHIDEAVQLKQKIADHNESMKGIVDAIKEKVEIDPKLFKALVNISFKNNAVERQQDISSLETAISMLFATNESSNDSDAD